MLHPLFDDPRFFAVLRIDADGFASSNEHHELAARHRITEIVGATLADSIGHVNQIGPLEFAVLLDGANHERALAIARQIRTQIVEQTERAGERTTVSVGVAMFPNDGTTRESLLDAAGGALYCAQHGGGNRTVTASSGERLSTY